MPQTREAPILRHRNKYHLPYDIVLNILTRLPVKSVMRLRCVSKSLDSSITSPHFISTHLNNINNKDDDDDDHRYLIHMPASSPPTRSINRSICTVALDRTFDAISEVRIPSDFSSNVDDIVGSCNGLLCLVDYTNNIYLWNPSVRKFKKLPHTCLKNLNYATLGFAYHSQNNDYKVVRIAYASWLPALPLPPSEIEVYTLSSDSWRRVGIDFTTNGVFFTKNHLLTTPLVSGALHWMAVEEIHNCEMIISFDVNSEEFRKLAQPHGSIDDNNINRCLASFKGKLAFITCGHGVQLGFQHSIWVMREYGVVESWNKLFVLPLETPSVCVAFTERKGIQISNVFQL
ncbi:F-box/kelch-repeat protein At3g06240 isoform X2 [Quercus suber]|uniref:F-box/kelch-repeat protein At3g06240 isoform X2 n=1 Tax=Quercus suber TaxID=58331 RepID=UPI000CE21D06|nr:F-box/kelch-repeat protein At3g06240-like isoform X2 [Quercus suber]